MSAMERSLLSSFSGPLLELLFPMSHHHQHSPDKEGNLFPVLHSCQSQILQLTFLILSHNSHTNPSQSLVTSTAAFPVLLSLLLTDESLPSEIRYHSSQLLNLLLISSSSSSSAMDDVVYDSLSIPLIDIFNSHSMDYCPELEHMSSYFLHHHHHHQHPSHPPSAHKGNSLEKILNCIQTLRPPDSMNNSSGLIGSLAILTTLAQSGKYYLQTNNHQDGGEVCLPSCCCWKCFRCDWIIRSLHDRRAIVRLMSLHIISNSITPSHLCCCSTSASSSSSSSSFHLYDSLTHLLLDTLECSAVRMTSLNLLTQICVMEYSSSFSSSSPPPSLRKQETHLMKPHYNLLLGTIAENLSFPSSPSSSQNTNSSNLLFTSLQNLMTLLCLPFFISQESFIGLLISLKIIPKVVNLLDPSSSPSSSIFFQLIESCQHRVHVSLPSHSTGDGDGDGDDVRNSCSSSMVSCVMEKEIKNQFNQYFKVKTLCLKILQRIHELGGYLFSSTIRHTNLIKNILMIITSTSLFPPTPGGGRGAAGRDGGGENGELVEERILHSEVFSAACDLFSTLLVRDTTRPLASQRKEHLFERFEMSQVTVDKAIVTSTVAHNFHRILSNIDHFYQQTTSLTSSGGNTGDSFLFTSLEKMLHSLLRSLCLLCSTDWKVGLGLGGDCEGYVASAPAIGLSHSLLSLWKRSENHEISFESTTTDAILFTLSCLLEVSYGLKFEMETLLTQRMLQIFQKFSLQILMIPAATNPGAAVSHERKIGGQGQGQGKKGGGGGIQKVKEKGQELKSRKSLPPSLSSSPW
jgi:hypothetical protein